MTTIHSMEEIPSFTSEAKEAAFWGSHQLSDELVAAGEAEPDSDDLLPPPRARTIPISMRFDAHTLRRAKKLAQLRGTGYQTLLRSFVMERLYEEEKREGLLK